MKKPSALDLGMSLLMLGYRISFHDEMATKRTWLLQ